MARRISSIVAAMMLLGGAARAAGPQDAAVEHAKTSARAWLVLHDGREFDQSWEAAGDLLQVAVTQKEWTAKWSVTMAPLGKVVSRGVKSAEYATTMRGAPDGEYVILKFDTAFETKQTAVETVILMKESDGLWRVGGFNIR